MYDQSNVAEPFGINYQIFYEYNSLSYVRTGYLQNEQGDPIPDFLLCLIDTS